MGKKYVVHDYTDVDEQDVKNADFTGVKRYVVGKKKLFKILNKAYYRCRNGKSGDIAVFDEYDDHCILDWS